MNREQCPYLGSLNGNSCRSTVALKSIAQGENGCGLSAAQLYEIYCHGNPSGCPAFESIRTEGHSSPWRK